MWMFEIPPFVPFFISALIALATRGLLRGTIMVIIPIVSALHLWMVPEGIHLQFTFLEYHLHPYRVDKLSLLFGYVFHIAALIAIIYSLHVRDTMQQVAAMMYAGSGLGAVFAGDLLTLFVFWELLAFTSVFLILARRTPRSYHAGMRYLIVQVLSGVILLAGTLFYAAENGTLEFGYLGLNGIATWLIFIAFGIKCAFPMAHNWLTDAYPEATVTGTVFLSIFTTKVAVYALARGYPGTELLVYIGAAMTCFPIFSPFLTFFWDHFGIYFWTRMETTKPEPERITMDGGLGFWRTIAAVLVVALLVVLPLKAVGSESSKACGAIDCDPFEAQLTNNASLQNGAKLAVNFCMGCHSFKYSRWERVATDIGIPHQLMLDNMIFTGQKIGGLMDIAMPADKAKEWFGATPPDLTLVARARSPEWVYTYLKNFYADPTRPLGVNNKVFKDVGMPHALLDLQGLPECSPGTVLAANGGIKRDLMTGADILDDPCGTFKINQLGTLSVEEYDSAVYDLVNFGFIYNI